MKATPKKVWLFLLTKNGKVVVYVETLFSKIQSTLFLENTMSDAKEPEKGMVISEAELDHLICGLADRHIFLDKFAYEIFTNMELNSHWRILNVRSPRNFKFNQFDSTTFDAFYARAMQKNYRLCSLADAYYFAERYSRDLGAAPVILAMIPTPCSDGQKRTLLFRKNTGTKYVDVLGHILPEVLELDDKFVFGI